MPHASTLQAHTRSHLALYAPHISHAVTVQTGFRPYEQDLYGLTLLREQAATAFKHFRTRLNRKLYGNNADRKAQTHRPVLLTSIEGFNTNRRDLTLHFHFALGNLPATTECNGESVKQVIGSCWNYKQLIGSVDVLEAYDACGWIDYITKERDPTTDDYVAWDLMQIPRSLHPV